MTTKPGLSQVVSFILNCSWGVKWKSCHGRYDGKVMAQQSYRVVNESSGNVFADLGLPNAEELGTKLRPCVFVNRVLDQRRLTQVEAARGCWLCDEHRVARHSFWITLHFR